MSYLKSPFKKPIVLVVDDERETIGSLSEILQMEGYEVCFAGSGEEALTVYAQKSPDIVLMDVRLPGIDGLEATRRLRAEYGENSAPILLMSGNASVLTEKGRFPVGVVDFLAKPLRAREALIHIRAHLSNHLYALSQHQLAAESARCNDAKNRFIGMCVHDLSSPIASIRGLAEFLKDPAIGTLNPAQSEIIASIHETSQTMLALVNGLLDIAAIEAGDVHLSLHPISLREVAAKASRLAALSANPKGTRVELLASPADPVLPLDAARIRQVVENLLSNAVKFSPPGSVVTVSIDELDSPESGRLARLSVRDQGPGIPEAERHNLFQDFGRLSTQPTGGEKSTGLGLSICRRIITAHSGELTATNLPEGGCVFSFSVPIPS
jgi:signal transduction histidine kinase